MNAKMTISLRRDRIQFEDGGNRAWAEWVDAATRAIEADGYTADVEAGHGKDTTKFDIFVSVPAAAPCGECDECQAGEPCSEPVELLFSAKFERGTTSYQIGCITAGHYQVEATAEVFAAFQAAEAADSAGREAASHE